MTYSIVARDPSTGELGVGVQTHHLATGATVPWLRSGTGAIATQAEVDMAYGANGLGLLDIGVTPTNALIDLMRKDATPERRQVGIVDSRGRTAAHTGADCIGYAGHVEVDGAVFLANLMTNPGVPEAMVAVWARTDGAPLVDRILDCLDAAELAGGDLRGAQSATVKVSGTAENWWDASIFDLRVDDHETPLIELRRLVGLQREYQNHESLESRFWHAVRILNEGGDSNAELASIYAEAPQWQTLFDRLPESILKDDER